jgi:peroxiredoxin
LRRWEELRPELEKRNVELVALCPDTPEQIREGMAKHAVKAVMLSDADLAVTRKYNLENTARMVKPPGVAGLPVPTTILADAAGTVRWIDQAKDYQMRSQPDRVLRELKAALG